MSDGQAMSNDNPLGLKQTMTSPRGLDTNSNDTKETLTCTYLRHKHRLNTYLHLPEKTQAEHRQAKGTKTVSDDSLYGPGAKAMIIPQKLEAKSNESPTGMGLKKRAMAGPQGLRAAKHNKPQEA